MTSTSKDPFLVDATGTSGLQDPGHAPPYHTKADCLRDFNNTDRSNIARIRNRIANSRTDLWPDAGDHI